MKYVENTQKYVALHLFRALVAIFWIIVQLLLYLYQTELLKMMHLLVVIAVLFVATVNAGVMTPNPSSSSTYKGAVVLDDSPYIAPGTPFQKAKIADSVVDLIGGTPLVSF